MKRILAFFALATVATPVFADDAMLGKPWVTSESGAPFCTDVGQLREYMMAGLQNDEKWMGSLESCAFVKGGLKVAIIEDLPGSDLGHVVRARLFGSGGSTVGYTLSLGLSPQAGSK
jgi:hypothetical protein